MRNRRLRAVIRRRGAAPAVDTASLLALLTLFAFPARLPGQAAKSDSAIRVILTRRIELRQATGIVVGITERG